MAQSYAAFVVLYTGVSNSFPRPPLKHAVAAAFVNAVSHLGNVAGSCVSPYSYVVFVASVYPKICLAEPVRTDVSQLVRYMHLDCRLHGRHVLHPQAVPDFPEQGAQQGGSGDRC